MGIGLNLPTMIVGPPIGDFKKISFVLHLAVAKIPLLVNFFEFWWYSLRIFKLPCFFVKTFTTNDSKDPDNFPVFGSGGHAVGHLFHYLGTSKSRPDRKVKTDRLAPYKLCNRR